MSPPVDPVQSDPSLPKSADVVIIGGGIIGSATAYYLTKRGMKVAIVEKGRIAGESGFRRTGVLYVTQDPQELAKWERWMEHARAYQLHSRLLSASEAQAMTPGCTHKWIGGLHTPSDGRAEPSMAAPAIATAARNLSVTIHQNCAARGLETEAGAVSGVITEHGTI